MRAAVLFSFLLFASSLSADPTVTVTSGAIRGAALDHGGAAFKGIPYAQPPVGELRWKPPAAVKAWTGERDATAFGAPCAQNAGKGMMAKSSEDCLFLNVWAPEWPAKTKKPVMLWLHGGGNFAGTASGNNFDGESLARHGVVLVTANFRLSIFGFFALPDLTKESPHHASGNYGLMDQIAVLQWIHDNIARFGGDPANVTVFGQSAGAVDANVLMTSPLTKGLFHRAIAESGVVARNPDAATMAMTALAKVMAVKEGPVTFSEAPLLPEAENEGVAIASKLNAPPTGALKFLRDLPAGDLLKPMREPKMAIGPSVGVIVDGWVLPKVPGEVFAKGQEHRMALLLGNNSLERTVPPMPEEELKKAIEAMYGPLAPKAFALYGLNGEAKPKDPLYGDAATQWTVDTMYRCPVVNELVWHSKDPSWEYQFDRTAPGREALGAVHATEVAYVFGALNAKYSASEHETSAAMEDYWTSFAKTGNPNGSDSKLTQWPKFDATARGFLEFKEDGAIAAEEGLRRPYCDLFIENVKRLQAEAKR